MAHSVSNSDEIIIKLEHITKAFPGIIANDDISLEIKKGEIFALLGENGAGKSTLMSMLCGMYTPDSGRIFIRGKEEHISSPAYAAQINIGIVYQHFKLIHNYSIAENIVLGAEPTKKIGPFQFFDKEKANAEISALSKRYGLEVDPQALISDIQVSTQQRVEILKMLYRDAEILIFDEPTAMLTPQEIEFLLEIIRNLRANGKTIILITHKLDEIKQIADRCAILCRGKLAAVVDVPSTDKATLAKLMVGHDLVDTLDKIDSQSHEVILDVKKLNVFNENGQQVLKNINFQVHAGEIFVVAGVAGNGQIELADAIYGMQSNNNILKVDDDCTITLDQQEISKKSIKERLTAGLVYIPEDRQAHGLMLDFRLDENLALRRYQHKPFNLHGFLNKQKIANYAEDLIARYDIRSSKGKDSIVRSMSGGNQQKAIIAREIAEDAKLLIIVQPTRGLDVGAIENIHKEILAERAKGKAILLISLDLDEILKLADTIAVIYNGEFLKIAAASAMDRYEVGRYMMGVKDEA